MCCIVPIKYCMFAIQCSVFDIVLCLIFKNKNMKKTCTVNIHGVVFNIDEDAYELLSSYIKSIKQQFANESEQNEVMADIEERIAELFKERVTASYGVITLADVKHVISVMGNPSDFSDNTESQERGTRKFYRNGDDKVLGGVCSGLAVYLNTESWVIRLILILLLLFAGTGLLVYLILWIIVPEAVTPSQKLEMQGKPVTLENLMNSAKKEFYDIKNRMNRNH